MRELTRALVIGLAALGAAATTARLHAEVHKFVPREFATTLSGTAAPVLKIKSGDRVVTTTVDDMGMDGDGKTLAKGPNRQTGPFYIQGAEPGDLIVVSIEKLEPSRMTGTSSSNMMAATYDADGLSNKPAPRVPWTVDTAKGVVRLDLQQVIPNIDWRTRYTSTMYELPLRPMLGSLGVAPAGDGTGAMAGSFGGDVDYPGLTAGTKVLLPVYQTGALLFLGHGLARQGDGAVGGEGITVPMNVQFSVELVKKKEWPHSSVMRASTVAGEFPIEWPRLETDSYVMTIGTAPSLQEALKHATTELHHWLDDDFGFSERSLSIFLAQALEYEVANAAGPNFTVIAKVKRAYLPREAAPQ